MLTVDCCESSAASIGTTLPTPAPCHHRRTIFTDPLTVKTDRDCFPLLRIFLVTDCFVTGSVVVNSGGGKRRLSGVDFLLQSHLKCGS